MTTAQPQLETTTTSLRLWAIVLSLVVNIGGLGAFLLPGQEDVPAGAKVATFVFAAIGVLGAWGLWKGRRWGANLTIGITALNALSGLPALGDPPSAAMVVAVIIGVVLAVPVIVILTRRSVRRELR